MNSSEQMPMTKYFNQRRTNILRDEKIINNQKNISKVNIDVVRALSEDKMNKCSDFFDKTQSKAKVQHERRKPQVRKKLNFSEFMKAPQSEKMSVVLKSEEEVLLEEENLRKAKKLFVDVADLLNNSDSSDVEDDTYDNLLEERLKNAEKADKEAHKKALKNCMKSKDSNKLLNSPTKRNHDGKSFYESPRKLKTLINQSHNKEKEIREKNLLKKKHLQSNNPSKTYSKGLPLPLKYKKVEDNFRSVDDYTCMLYNRNEVVTWKKISVALRNITRSNFTRKQLAQICYVYPQAFKLEIKNKDLVIQPISDQNASNTHQISANQILQRRRKFHSNLIKIVMKYHQDFLQTIQFPANDTNWTNWHPKFSLNNLPDIPTVTLPAFPVLPLKKSNDLKKMNLTQIKPPAKVMPPAKEQIFGRIPLSLLEKVKNRELANQKRESSRSNGDEKKLAELKDLPQIARLLKSIYLSERKSSLRLDYILLKLSRLSSKLTSSSKSMISTFEDITLILAASVESRLRSLEESSSNWITFTPIGKTEFVKMDKTRIMSDVIKSLEKDVQQFQRTF